MNTWTTKSLNTKNTFVNIDMGDFRRDPRRVQTWNFQSTPMCPIDDSPDFDSTSADEEHEQLSDSADDWDCDEISCLKTIDPMDGNASIVKEVFQPTSHIASDWDNDEINRIKTIDPMEDNSWKGQGTKRYPEEGIPAYINVHQNTSAMSAGQLSAAQVQFAPVVQFVSAVQSPLMWGWSPTQVPVTGRSELEQSRNIVSGNPVPLMATQSSHAKIEKHETTSGWTCRMLKNIPNDYTRQDLLDWLDSNSIQYDFIYLPTDWSKGANLGYAFLNLVSFDEAERIAALLNGFSDWKVPSEKVCEVAWGTEQRQGLHRIIEQFRNSPVMHSDVPEEYKPLMFKSGQRIPFPAPTKRIRPPPAFQRKTENKERLIQAA